MRWWSPGGWRAAVQVSDARWLRTQGSAANRLCVMTTSVSRHAALLPSLACSRSSRRNMTREVPVCGHRISRRQNCGRLEQACACRATVTVTTEGRPHQLLNAQLLSQHPHVSGGRNVRAGRSEHPPRLDAWVSLRKIPHVLNSLQALDGRRGARCANGARGGRCGCAEHRRRSSISLRPHICAGCCCGAVHQKHQSCGAPACPNASRHRSQHSGAAARVAE